MYDNYQFSPELQKEMDDFNAQLAANREKFEREVEEYYAQKNAQHQKAFWEKVNERQQQQSPTYTSRQDILNSCRHRNPNGGSYISLGEFYQKYKQT